MSRREDERDDSAAPSLAWTEERKNQKEGLQRAEKQTGGAKVHEGCIAYEIGEIKTFAGIPWMEENQWQTFWTSETRRGLTSGSRGGKRLDGIKKII